MDTYSGTTPGANSIRGGAFPADRPTDMETLSSMAADNRRRLREALLLTEARLDNFTSAPSALQGSKGTEQAAEPQPGTLGSLRHITATTSDEINRLEAIVSRLRELL